MSIFDERTLVRPYEYPEVIKYSEAVQHSYWLVSEFDFSNDVQDYRTKITDKQRTVIKRAMLAISQIEVAVKSFWGKVGDRLPKPEIQEVGAVMAESETRHFNFYAKLLGELGLNHEFEEALQQPEIQGRVEYLKKYLTKGNSSREAYVLHLTLFTLLIENASLFSQFLIIKLFRKEKNMFIDIESGINATQKEELIHAMFGAYLINKIKEEYPEYFDAAFYDKIAKACKKAYEAECKIIDWIFDNNDLDFITREEVKEFVKLRINDSLDMIGAEKLFTIDWEKLKRCEFFITEIYAFVRNDFFNNKSANYTKRSKSVTSNDLF